MNKRQKSILINFIAVIIVTAIAVVAMVNLKDYINRSEAIKAMEHLGRLVLQYRKEQGLVPPQSYVDSIRGQLEGSVRLSNLQYRARWVDFDCPDDTILAYSPKEYPSSYLNDGYVVLRLNGTVEWIEKEEFQTLLYRQQTPEERNTPLQ